MPNPPAGSHQPVDVAASTDRQPEDTPAAAAAWTPRRLGPHSLLWRYGGDRRLAFTGLSAGILQLMHPAVGAGVAQHSAFFSNPWDRIFRSIPQILGTIYDPQIEAVGHRVRDYHRDINGIDDRDRPYRALEPATFWWAHATFQHAVEQIVDRFDPHRLTTSERENLYLDGVEWYRRYGMPMSDVPRDYRAYQVAWLRYRDEVLEMTPAAERVLDIALNDRSVQIPNLPSWVGPLQSPVVTPILRLTAIGGLPAAIRDRFAIPWRHQDELGYRSFSAALARTWRFLPRSVRYSRAVPGTV